MANNYRKGYAAERELVHKLYKRGFATMRAPRSGRMGIACPDVVAAKNGKLAVIECKSRKSAFSIDDGQIEQMKEWKKRAGAKCFVGWKISYKGWFFIKLDDVIKNNGNLGLKFANEKGIGIDELVDFFDN